MAVDFNSPQFRQLPKEQQKKIIIDEFTKCKESFKYFVDNYAYIRHAKGILKAQFFDYQYDVCIPISYVLQYGRTKEAQEKLKEYKFHYDYNKHMEFLIENYKEVYEKIPADFHDFYKVAIHHPFYNYYPDTIILKSRQTGLSTALQVLISWHVNFYPVVYDLVLSQGDREAKKFVSDVQRTWELIPGVLRAKKMKMNDHELWVSLTGSKDTQSGVQALPPTPNAGRSYSPNLVVLDEFAMYKKAEEVYTAVSMALSTGGVMVIISTPKGIGNLYHQLWEVSKKYFSTYIKDNPLADGNNNGEEFRPEPGIFKPVVVHWSQLPVEEFKRRGFDNPIDWYYFMANKLKLEGGEKKVAQELDLDFITSGDTLIPHSVLKKLRTRTIEKVTDNIIQSEHIPGLTIYEKPKPNCLYICGVDVSEGVGKDYSVIYVVRISDEDGSYIIPKIVAKYTNNRIPPVKFAQVIKTVGELYNNALINFEKNNPGLVIQTELIDKGLYDPLLIFNRYNPTNGKFVKTEKGWRTTKSTKPFLLSTLTSFIVTYQDGLNLPTSLLDEFLTFFEDKYHDDEVIAYGLAIVGYQLIDKYRDFLIETKQYNNQITNTELNDILPVYSSEYTPIVDEDEREYKKVRAGKVTDRVTAELVKAEIEQSTNHSNNKDRKKNNDNKNPFGNRPFLSRVVYPYGKSDDSEEDGGIFVF